MQTGTLKINTPRWRTILKVVFIFVIFGVGICIGTQFNKPQKTVVTKIIESKYLTNEQKKGAFVVDRQTDVISYGETTISDNHKVDVGDHTMWGFNSGEQIKFPSTIDFHTTYTHNGQVIGEGSHSSTGTTTIKFTDMGIESTTEVKDNVQEAFILKQEPKLWEVGIEGTVGTEVSIGAYVQRELPIYQSEHFDINAYIKGEVAKDFTNNDIDIVVNGGICGRF